MTILYGYRGRAYDTLQQYDMTIGDRIRVDTDTLSYAGTIMPRYDNSDDLHIVLKLENGYNVGISLQNIRNVTVIPNDVPLTTLQDVQPFDPSLPDILLLSTGGTIASRIDYRTGAVTPTLDAAEISASIPELSGIANIHPVPIMSEYSENITPEHWTDMARHIDGIKKSKYAGIIVAHGTDTMHYTAAYLSYALAGYSLPIVMTGSQRSSDRASSDAAPNLVGAATAIADGIPRGVYIAMHLDQNDGITAIHPGTRVRKCHTSSRDAFRTINGPPAYLVRDSRLEGERSEYYQIESYMPRIGADRRAILVKYHPGYNNALLSKIPGCGYRAVILEGTGLGHIGRESYDAVKDIIDHGIFVGMSSQCLEGRVRMTVYESGRDLLQLGVVPLEDMLPETALVKAMWALSFADDIHDIMLKPISSDLSW